MQRGLKHAVGVLDDVLQSACVTPGLLAKLGRDRQVELGERQRHLVELGVGGSRSVEEKGQDVVVRDVLRSARDHLEDALCIDHGPVWDRRHPHDGLRSAGLLVWGTSAQMPGSM